MSATQSELRVARQIDERETTQKLHQDLIAAIEARDDKVPSDVERTQLTGYRERIIQLDEDIKLGVEDIERDKKAIEEAQAVRRVLSGAHGAVEVNGDEVAYPTLASYARDVLLTFNGRETAKIAQRVGATEVEQAAQRLQLAKRSPANTLSSNVAGLIPEQHIAEIFQVINDSRPLVASAGVRLSLERGTLSFPKVTQRPVVAVQASEKTEAGNQGMIVTMETATASTYLGGGDLSWQAINWSTPDALELWFRLAAADYALKTETDAATVVSAAAFLNNIASTLGATPSFADLMTALGAGLSEVYANSGRIADTLWLAPDRAFYLFGLTSDTPAVFANGSLSVAGEGSGNIASLRVVVSRGLNSGEMIVGDSDALIVAETGGAPVELHVVEPAIGGVEVGIIGAFEAVVAEDEAFALITTAS